MIAQKYKIVYEVNAESVNEVRAIALEIFERTHLEPSQIQLIIPWDTQDAIKEINESRT